MPKGQRFSLLLSPSPLLEDWRFPIFYGKKVSVLILGKKECTVVIP
jgi:hypothetical protein